MNYIPNGIIPWNHVQLSNDREILYRLFGVKPLAIFVSA
jgi:hypothetical protein